MKIMNLDFSSYPIGAGAYSEKPMSFMDTGPSAMLGAVRELAMIETGNRAARERWQKTQLHNLLTHATQRSSFWRSRLGSRRPDSKLNALPILTRADVRQQVTQEGSLLRPTDALKPVPHGTSGSSGVPVHFFVSQMNVQYNTVRYLAQNFIEGRDLSVNKTQMGIAKKAVPACGFLVERQPSWLGELGFVFRTGVSKRIHCQNPNVRELIRELRKDAVGQLASSPKWVNTIVSNSSAALLRQLGVTEWIASGEPVDPVLYQEIVDQGIPVVSNYSTEEVGPIGFECKSMPGYYHVATSNVIVELTERSHEIDGKKFGRVLVTHLHSYATPFIRYDVDDFALLTDRCPCGHDGPTIHSLQGRVSNTLKRADGTLSAFFIPGEELLKIFEFTEFRVRQVALDEIVVEFGGCEALSPEQIAGVTAFVKARAGDGFKIDVKTCAAIDWGDSVKKLGFRREV
jgi:phenylacetate-CoA ligase